MKLDAHQHFWNYNTRDYGWIGEEMSVIRRSFLPEDLRPILTDSGISGCVAVQARQSLEETEWSPNLRTSTNSSKALLAG